MKHVCTQVCVDDAYRMFQARYMHICGVFHSRLTARDARVRAILATTGFPPLRVKRFRSRWGQYTVRTLRRQCLSHEVTLAVRLVHTSTECIDMVMMHELCHMRYRGHRMRFKALLGRMYPEWKRIERELKKYQKLSTVES